MYTNKTLIKTKAMSQFYKTLSMGLICLMLAFSSYSQIHSTSAGGDWDEPTTWIGYVPGAGDDVVINGPVNCYTGSPACNNITISSSGVLQNDYYGGTLNVNGNITNNGSINNYVSGFSLFIKGNITNNGNWNNSYTTLTGSSNHTIACQNNNSISASNFYNSGTGTVYINSEAYFHNVNIDLGNPIIIGSNATLKIHNGNLFNCDVSGTGSTSVVYGEGDFDADAPHFANVSFTDISFQGDNNIAGGCSTHGTVTNNGSLQNDYYGQVITINDNFINNGTIQNWVSGFSINLYGDFTNNGALINNAINLYGTTDQTFKELNNNSFNCVYLTSNKPTGKLKILTDIDFLNCQVNMDSDTMLVMNNSTVKLFGSKLISTVLLAVDAKSGNLKLDMNETSYIHNCHIFNPEILGKVKAKNNYFYGNILVTDTLENDYFGHTVNIYGDITNNGVIQNYVSALTLNIEGNIINNGIWNNSYTNLIGTTDQNINCLNGHKFSGYQFTDNNATGDIYVDNTLYFDNVEVHFNYHNLILPSNTQLKLHNGFLKQCNVSGSGETSVVYGEGAFDNDAPFYQFVSFSDINFQGDNNFSNGCSSLGTIINNGSLQNDYFGQTLTVNGNFINNGIIQNWVSGFTFNLYGDFTNNGTMTNYALDFHGTTDQAFTQLNNNSFDFSYLRSYKPSGKIIASSDLTFNNVAIDLQHDTLIVPENSTISISSNYLYRADIHANTGGFNLFMDNSAYMHDCKLMEVSLSGTVDCNNSNVFNGTTTNNGILQNDYYSYTAVFNGDFTNNGTIKNNVSSLTMNMYGNIENNGVWDNITIGFYSTDDQEVSLDDGMVFSTSYFYSYKTSGKLIALTDLSFDNTDINLEHDTLIMPDNSALSISGNRLYRADIHATSGRFNLFMANNAYMHECNLSEVTLYGTVDCNNGNIFYGTTINNGIMQNDYYTYAANFYGDIINNGTIQNPVSSFIVSAHANITNNGNWNNYYTQLVGTTEQTVTLVDEHWIDGQMRFVSDVLATPYQWYWNGWAIQNPPYPQPAIINGETSSALTWISPVTSSWVGTYKCWAGGTYSRDIIINQATNLRLDLTANLEGPFNGTNMNTGLNAIIPLQQSLGVIGYDGPEAVDAIPNENIVDWIGVELRDAVDASLATESTTIGGGAAFIRNDGKIVGLDGNSVLSFDVVVTNQLFVLLWHRNHIAAMSMFAVPQIGGIYTYDFTTAANQAYGNNQSNLGGGNFGMIAGDANGDGVINDFDGLDGWIPQVGQTGYLQSDVNMNTQVNNQDKNDVWLPNYGKSEILPQ